MPRRYKKKRKSFAAGRQSRGMVPYSRKRRGAPRGMPKSLFGNKRFVVLKYHENLTLAGSLAGQPNANVYQANGMFNPNITAPGNGHQPRGFDEVMPLYQHYTVIQSKCSATFMGNRDPEFGTVWEGGMVGIALNRNSVPFLLNSDYLESRNVTFTGLPSHFSAPATRVTRSFNARSFLGITHPLSEANLRGDASTNAPESAFFFVFALLNVLGTDNGDVSVSVDIQFMAVFTEPKQPGQS